MRAGLLVLALLAAPAYGYEWRPAVSVMVNHYRETPDNLYQDKTFDRYFQGHNYGLTVGLRSERGDHAFEVGIWRPQPHALTALVTQDQAGTPYGYCLSKCGTMGTMLTTTSTVGVYATGTIYFGRVFVSGGPVLFRQSVHMIGISVGTGANCFEQQESAIGIGATVSAGYRITDADLLAASVWVSHGNTPGMGPNYAGPIVAASLEHVF